MPTIVVPDTNPAACPTNIIDILARQPAGTYTKDVLKFAPFRKNFWYSRPNRIPYPMHMGPSPLRRVAARQRGGDIFPYRQWRPSNGTGSAADNIAAGQPIGTPANNGCCPPAVQFNRGYLNKGINTYSLGAFSRSFCAKDFTESLDPAGDLELEFEGYGDQIAQMIATFQRNEFIRLCQTKIYNTPGSNLFNRVVTSTVGDPSQSENAGLSVAGATAAYLGLDPTVKPTSTLNQDLLTKVSQWLDNSGIDGITTMNGAQMYELVTSATTADHLLRDATNALYFQYADMGKGDEARLLGGLGQSQQFRNIVYRVDNYAPRLDVNYNFVPAFITIQADSGTEDIPNPAWFNAPYEISILYTDEVYDVAYPSVASDPGGNIAFMPYDYAGEIKFVLFPTSVSPLQNEGYFYSEIFVGAWAGKQRYAAVVIHLNCSAGAFEDCNGNIIHY